MLGLKAVALVRELDISSETFPDSTGNFNCALLMNLRFSPLGPAVLKPEPRPFDYIPPGGAVG